MLYQIEEFGTEGVRRGVDQSLNFEAAFSFYRSKAQAVQHEPAQDGEILSGMINASAHRVVADYDIHATTQAALDTSVPADGVIHALRVEEQAKRVIKAINSGLPLDRPLDNADLQPRYFFAHFLLTIYAKETPS